MSDIAEQLLQANQRQFIIGKELGYTIAMKAIMDLEIELVIKMQIIEKLKQSMEINLS